MRRYLAVKIKIIGVCILLMLLINTISYAADENRQTLNGKIIEVNNQLIDSNIAPVIENGTTMVPLKVITDALNLELNQNSNEKTISLKSETILINLQVGNQNATVNNQAVQLTVPPKMINGVIMVPISFFVKTAAPKGGC
jgi:hypothetical protein